MTVNVFLQQLEKNLNCLKPEERENAMSYYREYLEEAGDSAQQAIEDLGSPQSVAERILLELDEVRQNKSKSNAGNILFGISVILITCPFWMVILFLWLAFVFVFAVIVFSFACSAILAPIQGIVFMTRGLLGDGLWNVGAGLFCAGITMLIWKPCLTLVVNATKWLWKQTIFTWNRLFKKEAQA